MRMKVRLDDDHARLCSGIFGLDDGTHVAVEWNLYPVGTLMCCADGAYYLWCLHTDGIFSLYAEHNETTREHIGFILLVGGAIKTFFNRYSLPFDWWFGGTPFYLDQAFNHASMMNDESRPLRRRTTR